MNNNENDYLTGIKRLILSGDNVVKEKPHKELSSKEKKKCKSCKYYIQATYPGYCTYKNICTRPLYVACDKYIKRKK